MLIGEDRAFLRYVHDWLKNYLPGARCSSANTITSYRAALNALIDYFVQARGVPINQIRVEDITPAALSGFVDWLAQTRRLNAQSIRTRTAAVRSFVAYCALIDASLSPLESSLGKVKLPRRDAQQPTDMTTKALAAILAVIDTGTRAGARDHLAIVLLFEAGLRVQELVDLRLGDINTEDGGAILTVHGKGGKIRTVATSQKTGDYLRRYIADHHAGNPPRTPLLFTIHAGQPTKMSVDTPQKSIKRYADQARENSPDIPASVHPHSLRHLRATTLYRRGVPLSVIARILGHASVNTTQIYATPDMEMMRAALKSAGPQPTAPPGPPNPDQEIILRRLAGLK
jgi:site-specific recombinase XerD